MNEGVVDWQLEGDVAVRFQTLRDLLHLGRVSQIER
jgi:hypothetical protein